MTIENENISETSSPLEETEEEYPVEDFRRVFVLPKKIKQARIAVAIAQAIMGIFLVVLPILYFVDPSQNDTSLLILAIVGLIFGAVLVGLFPFNIAKTVNNKLILGKNSISIRNHFLWKIIPWKELQEILITEKLSSDPNNPKSIGISLIRFRTISKNAYFMADSYPANDVKELKTSTKEAYAVAIEGTDYCISEKTERPSVRSRFIYYYKALSKTTNQKICDDEEE